MQLWKTPLRRSESEPCKAKRDYFRKNSECKELEVTACSKWRTRNISCICNVWWCWHASLLAQTGKRLPAIWETRVRSLGQEDSLEKEMATYSSTLAWKIPWTEETGMLQSTGCQRVRHDWVTSLCVVSMKFLAQAHKDFSPMFSSIVL